MKKCFPILILLLGVYNIASTQSYKAYTEKAEEAVKTKNYSAALAYYHFLVTEAGRESIDNYHNAAESARRFRVYELAENYYQVVANDDKGPTAHPLTHYWLADVEKRQGKYFEAKAHFEAFLLGPGAANSFYADKARKEIEDCNWAMEETKKKSTLQIEHLDSLVNSVYTDLAPVKRGGKLYFTSTRHNLDNTTLEKEKGSVWIDRMGENIRDIDDISLTSVIVREEDKAALSQYDEFREDSLHVAHVAFANDGNRVVYSLCKPVNFTDTHCKLYYRDIDDKGIWGAKVALPEHINKTGYSTTQPSIGRDNEAKKTLLVFSSDRPDGLGGMDLWCTYINDDNTFDEPKNLSATLGEEGVNTKENDITPFWDETTQTLFFSSEGHKNLGSYDIYKVKKNGKNWGKPENMGYPMNSSYDDVYYSISDDGKEAFFSSNRKGSLCATEDSICSCNDIYKIEMPGIKLIIETYNSITRAPLFETKVDLDNLISMVNLNDTKVDTNFYTFGVDYQFEYKVLGTKEGYTDSLATFSTVFPRKDTIIRIPLYLEPQVILITKTYDISTGDTLALNETTVNISGAADLSQNKATTNELHFPLKFRKSYEVNGSKAGFVLTGVNSSSKISTMNIPAVPDTLYRDLYFCKGLELPESIYLYFDNDIPGPSKDRRGRPLVTTNVTYGKTNKDYIKRRKFYVKKDVNNDRVIEPNSQEAISMQEFFDQRVEDGLADLDAFAELIYNYFSVTQNPDSKVEITIQGHASTLSNPTYNLALTKRRVSSMRNHLREWTNGSQSMKPYYERISVTEQPMGSTKATTENRTPYYKLAACMERRVVITDVKVEDQCEVYVAPKHNSPLTLKVLTFNELTGEPLLGTTVDMESKTETNPNNHIYFYDIKRQTNYKIVGSKEGYTTSSKTHFSGTGATNPQIVRLYLRPKEKVATEEVKLRVITYHELTGEPLGGVKVNVGTGANTDIGLQSAVNDHTYLYGAKWKTNYKIEGSKSGYGFSKKEVYTSKSTPLMDGTVEVKLYLRPVVDLTTFTFDSNGGKALTDVKVDLIHVPNKALLESQQKADLYKYLYPINFRQSYMVIASKPGYSSDTTYVSTKDIPIVPTNLETKLYLCKHINLEPNISLYFDNDHPDPDCERVTTPLTYKQTYDAYLSNRAYFENKFSTGTEGFNEMIAFFDKDVTGGMNRLDAFAQELYNYFANAESANTKINITIRGHASLRSNPRYNLALTKRRVSSLRNYLRTWNKGGQDLGRFYNRIQVIEAPKGDKEACIGCYEKSSIKDLQACKDRRVDIISATVINACPSNKAERPGGTYKE